MIKIKLINRKYFFLNRFFFYNGLNIFGKLKNVYSIEVDFM